MDGKSIGAEIKFEICESGDFLNIYTTRPDTIYGATFIAVSINHKIVSDNLDKDAIEDIKKILHQLMKKKKNLV